MNPIFITALVLAGVGVFITLRYRKNEALQTTRKGLIPGFSTTDGEHLNFSPDPNFAVERLHEYHLPNRSRLVMVVRQISDKKLPSVIGQGLAKAAQTNTNAQCVFVRVVDADGQTQYRCLFAPDSGGWTGNEPVEFVGQMTHA